MSKAPICESCGVQRVERTNKRWGTKFYGCKNWPKCGETAEHEDADPSDVHGNMSFEESTSID